MRATKKPSPEAIKGNRAVGGASGPGSLGLVAAAAFVLANREQEAAAPLISGRHEQRADQQAVLASFLLIVSNYVF